MKYLGLYLAAGVTVITVMMIYNRCSKKDKTPSIDEILDIHKPRWRRMVEDILGITVLSTVWPIVIVGMIVEKFSKKDDAAMEEEKEFAVEPAHLKKQISIEEIEQRERVFDPLGAVPDKPFGHLHAAWQKLLNQMEPGDTIWTFEAIWTPWYGGKDLMVGYVIKRENCIGPHLLTLSKKIELAD